MDLVVVESEKDRRPIDAAAAPSAAGEQGILWDGLNVQRDVLPAIRLRAAQPLLLIAVRTTADDGTGNTMLDKADDNNRNSKENLVCSKNETTMLNNLSPKK